jgi:hypothetical protein
LASSFNAFAAVPARECFIAGHDAAFPAEASSRSVFSLYNSRAVHSRKRDGRQETPKNTA